MRGCCLHLDPDRMRDDIAAASPNAVWSLLQEYVDAGMCRIEATPDAGSFMDLNRWEDHFADWTGSVATHGDQVHDLIAGLLDGRHGLAVIDPFFWTDWAEETEARERLLRMLVDKQAAWLTVVSLPKKANEGVAAARATCGTLPIHARKVSKGPMFHDRFYAVIPSHQPPEVGIARLAVSLGPGVRSFRSEDCIRCVVALDPTDFVSAWNALWPGATPVP